MGRKSNIKDTIARWGCKIVPDIVRASLGTDYLKMEAEWFLRGRVCKPASTNTQERCFYDRRTGRTGCFDK